MSDAKARAITAAEALKDQQWAIVHDGVCGLEVYGLYKYRDTAERICRDLNRRYRDITMYEVAHIDV